ncbi:uncharacterized protein A4U43_C03F7750 [Asparagus officinalis]|uniref:Uncharacterized protein n=1 Tax=Asparagus officinalis TaxID=4686 RepID=A0A5P1F868_ASPOF|nr:uncharacterized protein LOC109833200 isoform X2 [Asparagus officinalis]ONK74566.1 uncharacterized protein A4U43_C03F7750 [Asparagus officinalis]
MNQNSHHRAHSMSSVPFSWENRPGISKIAPQADESPLSAQESPKSAQEIKPPPPPVPDDSPKRPMARHSTHVPLPPCPFQPISNRYAASKGWRRDEDPFLAAYMECTKSVKKNKGKGSNYKLSSGWGFSCKQGTGVREDVLVKVPQLKSHVGKLHGGDENVRLLFERTQRRQSVGNGNVGGHQGQSSFMWSLALLRSSYNEHAFALKGQHLSAEKLAGLGPRHFDQMRLPCDHEDHELSMTLLPVTFR